MSAAVDVRGVTAPEASPALLLVEDSEADVVALQRVLHPLGVALWCVASGEEAVQALERQDFVAVLLDVYLAGAWDGFETARRLRELPGRQAVPLLFMTGAPQDRLLSVRAYRAGAVDFLHKPLFAELLTAKLSVFLELWRARERERNDLRAREAEALRRAEAERQRVDALNATLVAQQEWLQSVLRWLPVPLLLVERGTARILFANAKADEYWGTAEDDFAREFLLTDLAGRVLPASESPLVRAARGESLSGLQVLARTPRGARALLVDTAQVPALGERPACAVVTFQDITPLEEAERALRKREEEYRSLAESMPQAVWTAGPDGRVDYVNRVFAALLGKSVEAAQATPWVEFIHPEDLSHVTERWAHALREVEPYEREYRMRCVDGAYRWFLVRALPMRDAHGRPLRWFGTATDVDGARRASEAHRFLAEASALLGNSLDSEDTLQQLSRLAVPTLADWCLVDRLDERGHVEHLAVAHPDPEKARRLHERLRDRPWRPDAPRGVGRVLRTGEPDWMGHIPERAFQEATWEGDERRELIQELGIRAYIVVPLVAGGRVLGALTLMQAESGRHYTEGDVRLAEDLARRAALAVDNARLYQASQQAVRLRDEFLSVASHELRTPLTPIRITVQSLRRHTQAGGTLPADRVASVLDTVSTQTRRLTRLVDALLDVSHFSAGRLELHREPVDLATLLREVCADFEADCVKAGCALEVHAPGPVVAGVDRHRLEQAVSHLLSNAVKYGAGRPIQLALVADGGRARLTVKDEGIGIAPEALPRLFGKFARAVSERHYGGLGLGLYLAREIVEAHGGTIRVESQPGRGALFEVSLPLGQKPT